MAVTPPMKAAPSKRFTANTIGTAATGFGGGGSGAATTGGAAAVAGGNGSDGCIVIYEYA